MVDDLVERSWSVIPFAKLTPEACHHIADAAREAIRVFETWDLHLPETSRLRMSASHLAAVACAGNFGSTEEELYITAQALHTAIDFFQVAQHIDSERSDAVAAELVRALRGTLDARTKDSNPYDIQTQFWFGVLLAKAGLKPRVPPSLPGAKPDFQIEFDTLEIAVEVKRPQNFASARRALDTAAGQLRDFGKPGMIALDISECFGAAQLIVGAKRAREPAAELVKSLFRPSVARLVKHVRSYDRSDKYNRIVCLGVWARIVSWHKDLDEPNATVFAWFESFPTACAGLLADSSRRLASVLHDGVEELTGDNLKRYLAMMDTEKRPAPRA